jgi:hypothetical protein
MAAVLWTLLSRANRRRDALQARKKHLGDEENGSGSGAADDSDKKERPTTTTTAVAQEDEASRRRRLGDRHEDFRYHV